MHNKNIKRNKIRYRTIVVSIVISIVLFLSVSGYISNVYSNETEESKYDDYRMNIALISSVNDDCIEKVINYIEYNNLVKDYYIYEIPFTLDKMLLKEEEVSDTIKQMIKDKVITQEDLYENGYFNMGLIPFKFSDNIYNYLLDKAGVNNLKDNEIIIINTINKKTKYGDKIKITNLNIGDNVTTNSSDKEKEIFKISRNIR